MKTKKVLASFLSLVMVLGMLVVPASATTWDGITVDTSWYNTTDASFTIDTPAEFVGFGKIISGKADGISADAFAGKTVILGADLDMGSKSVDPAGTTSKAFKGTFDGAGHIISNVIVADTATDASIGLFGRISGGTIKNVGLDNVTVSMTASDGSSSGVNVGALVGELRDSGATMDKCFVRNVTLTGSAKVGSFGCLVGKSRGGVTISNSYSTNLTVGTVMVNSRACGIIGLLDSSGADKLTNLYTANLNFAEAKSIGVGNISNGNAVLTNVYYDTVGTHTSTGSNKATGVSADALKAMDSISLGSEFKANANPDYNDGYPALVWETVPAVTYDTSWYTANPDAQSFTIADALDFAGFAKLVTEGTTFAGKTIVLADDIDFGGAEINPVGTQDKAFQGTFNGNNKVISNVKVVNANSGAICEMGLFARVKGATIKNLGIENIEIAYGYTGTSGARFVGGLVGHAREGAVIDNCYVRTVTLSEIATSGEIAGALIGQIRDNVTVKNSYAVNRIIGENVHTEALISGLIGIVNASGSASTIENCYAGKYNYNASYAKVVGAVRDNHASTTITNLYYDTFQWVGMVNWKDEAKGTVTNAIKTLDGIEIGSAFKKNINEEYNFGYPTLVWEDVPLVASAAEVTGVSSIKASDEDMATGIAISVIPNNYAVNGIAWAITNENAEKAEFNTAFATTLSGEGAINAALYIEGLYIENFAKENVAISAITGAVDAPIVTME